MSNDRAADEDSFEIVFPISFIVPGTPVSQQGSAKSKTAWKERVREATFLAVPVHKWVAEESLSVTIYDFPEADTEGDVDNIVKPILDAMNKRIFADDQQVDRLVVQRFLPAEVPTVQGRPLVAEAYVSDPPFVFVYLKTNPLEDAQ